MSTTRDKDSAQLARLHLLHELRAKAEDLKADTMGTQEAARRTIADAKALRDRVAQDRARDWGRRGMFEVNSPSVCGSRAKCAAAIGPGAMPPVDRSSRASCAPPNNVESMCKRFLSHSSDRWSPVFHAN
jgi:hypothetical protein